MWSDNGVVACDLLIGAETAMEAHLAWMSSPSANSLAKETFDPQGAIIYWFNMTQLGSVQQMKVHAICPLVTESESCEVVPHEDCLTKNHMTMCLSSVLAVCGTQRRNFRNHSLLNRSESCRFSGRPTC